MPGRLRKQPGFARRPFVAYFLLLLFVCACLAVLVSQRLDIARRGEQIIMLHNEALRLRAQQCRLRLEAAREGPYAKLRERAEKMNIRLVPPEEAAALAEPSEAPR